MATLMALEDVQPVYPRWQDKFGIFALTAAPGTVINPAVNFR
jgi:hypothetical protein